MGYNYGIFFHVEITIQERDKLINLYKFKEYESKHFINEDVRVWFTQELDDHTYYITEQQEFRGSKFWHFGRMTNYLKAGETCEFKNLVNDWNKTSVALSLILNRKIDAMVQYMGEESPLLV